MQRQPDFTVFPPVFGIWNGIRVGRYTVFALVCRNYTGLRVSYNRSGPVAGQDRLEFLTGRAGPVYRFLTGSSSASYAMPDLKNNNRNDLHCTSNGDHSNFVPATVPKRNLPSGTNFDSSSISDHVM